MCWLVREVAKQVPQRQCFKGIESVAHTSTWAIIDDNAIAIFKSFLLCNNLGNIEKIAKYLYVPLFSL
jgi:hypothetical protein